MPLKHNSCAVGRSHVISPRDGAFTLLAGGGSGCRPGAPSLFKRSPQTPLPGSRRDGALSRAVVLEPNRVVVYPRVPHVPAAAGLMRGYSSTSTSTRVGIFAMELDAVLHAEHQIQ